MLPAYWLERPPLTLDRPTHAAIEEFLSLQQSGGASGVSAISPSGAEFTLAFFDTEAEASEAAEGGDRTAVANAVVTAADEQLTAGELATVEECVRGG